ncbi:hypothetical protein [Pseudomonas syringae]|uniref:hypothetical protein n=1 Tax=Pseudomonas syringae TaxID=317 RepID=UPI001F1791EA|nr:hypothetical protein [Pseudomonas syringae]MCF5467828.1 hypothetical protein [Pseudomonas syringae]MCF5472353.1 hypothetical protein [Pseudomonas syringae]MCF5481669.1 hypothetical protein [Pseudomonas syringae]MCF5488088.1 hypothetical protein [Pseudomonas syringae]MCF5494009.1 hypothetical protein [Pseudomonas syringae]
MTIEHLAYGVAVKKNADIKNLTEQVHLAQNRVTQQQAIVDSLQAKANAFTTRLGQATNTQASTLANYNLARSAMYSVTSLESNFKIALGQARAATEHAAMVSEKMANLIGKLIFSVEIINKVTLLINKQRVSNIQIPASMATFMAKATSDANNAVALTLTALQSCYAAESTLLDSLGGITLAARQAGDLDDSPHAGGKDQPAASPAEASRLNLSARGNGVVQLLKQAHENAVLNYNNALTNNDEVVNQLTQAQSRLAYYLMKLTSSKSGLNAANAAALAA